MSGPGSGSELLLDAWREPDSVYDFTLSQWDRLIPLARQARLLASLAARLDGFRGLVFPAPRERVTVVYPFLFEPGME